MNQPDNTGAPEGSQPFRLETWQVPEPPKSKAWACHLRWMVAVMDADDSSLHFIASCLSHCVKNGGLSEKQERAVTKCLDRIMSAYNAEILECQL